jgi:hypothetical protein
MKTKLASDDGKARYAKRRETVEPAFVQIKEHQGACRFLRRGLRACQAEWKLLCGTHNLLKLWRHTAIQQAAQANHHLSDHQTRWSRPSPAPSASYPARRPRLQSAREPSLYEEGPGVKWWDCPFRVRAGL